MAASVSGLVLGAMLSVAWATMDKPNIIFIAVDDLGWNDVGWVNPDIISPNLNKLAKAGIVLDQYYVQPVCTPSRTAWMTGMYPYRLGMQHLVILPASPACVPTNQTFLPQIFKKNGYSTHALGKWHLGMCNWECTPTYRGFDSFLGFWQGGEDHYTKQVAGGYDFRNGTVLDKSANGTYSSYQMADRMEQIIHNVGGLEPIFMYAAFQNVHEPMQAPQKYLDMYPNIKNSNRKHLSAMVTATDDAVGRLVAALDKKGITNNTLIIFSADNGGWTTFGGNNYPLRGGKVSIFEGGTRVAGFVNGPESILNKKGDKFEGLMHAVDWFPTLMSAAGLNYTDNNQDGMSQWEAINSRGPAQREEIIYNMDLGPQPLQGRAAIRMGDYKLIDGFPGLYEGWVKPDTVDASQQFEDADYLNYETIAAKLPQGPGNFTFQKYLFNLKDDPTEHHNLYLSHFEIAQKLEKRLKEVQQATYRPPFYPPADPKGQPSNNGGNWEPGWC